MITFEIYWVKQNVIKINFTFLFLYVVLENVRSHTGFASGA